MAPLLQHSGTQSFKSLWREHLLQQGGHSALAFLLSNKNHPCILTGPQASGDNSEQAVASTCWHQSGFSLDDMELHVHSKVNTTRNSV